MMLYTNTLGISGGMVYTGSCNVKNFYHQLTEESRPAPSPASSAPARAREGSSQHRFEASVRGQPLEGGRSAV